MKKYLIGIGSLLLIAFATVMIVSARDSKDDPKNAKGEAAKTEVTSPCSATCNHATSEKAASCDPETCPAHEKGKCDPATCTAHKDGKCDPATCPSHQEAAKACDQSKAGCPGKCHSAEE